MSGDSNRPQGGWRIARLGAGAALLVALLIVADLRVLIGRLAEAQLGWLVAIWLLAIPCRVLRAAKWQRLLAAHQLEISLWCAVRLGYLSQLAAACTPAGIGSEAYRLAALRSLGDRQLVLGTMLWERYVALAGLVCWSLATMPWTLPHLLEHLPPPAAGLCAAAGLLILGLPLLAHPRLGRLLPVEKFRREVARLAARRGALLRFFLLGLLELLGYFLINYLAARALGIDVSMGFILASMPLVHLAVRIPLAPQALGIQEGAFALAFLLGGFSLAQGMAVALLLRALDWLCTYLPALMLLVLPNPHRYAAR